MRTITLTTDFGTRDWFVGVMKGVIAAITPGTNVIDLTHEIPPGDIRAGAFALASAYSYFPKETVHVVVVDPGVGSARRGIAVRTDAYCFVGPDNGVLSWALAREQVSAVHALENPEYLLQPVSRTFHGRDIFAPAAARLCGGTPLDRLGPAVEEFIRIPWPEPRGDSETIEGEVVYIDRFGNAITNIGSRDVEAIRAASLCALAGRDRVLPLAPFYQAVGPGQGVAVLGSSGFLEIAINQGNAASEMGLQVGSPVRVRKQG